MKKIILLALLAFNGVCFAQEITPKDTSKDEPIMTFFIGGGAAVNSKFKIDDKLEASNLNPIQSTVSDFTFGLNTLFKKGIFEMEAASNIYKKSNSPSTSNGTRATFRMRGQYNFLNSNKLTFSGGLNLAMTTNDFNIYSNYNQVDLNSLATSTSDYIRLRNTMFYAGPSVSFGVKLKGEQFMKLNVGYEIAFASSKWKSDYANVSNSINENGQNRLMIGVVIFFKSHLFK